MLPFLSTILFRNYYKFHYYAHQFPELCSLIFDYAPIKCCLHLPHLEQTLRLRKGLLMTVAPKGWGLGVRMRFFVVVDGEDGSGSLWGANATR